MNVSAIRLLFDYSAWAGAQVWRGIESLTEEQFVQENPYSRGSIRNQMVHIANTDARWMALVMGSQIPVILKPTDFPTREDVSRLWQVVYDNLEMQLEQLTHNMVIDPVQFVTTGGQLYAIPGWQALLHTINHGTDHRAQALYALNRMGAKTAEQDFIYYLREELPPRGFIKIDADMMRALLRYDAYATMRLVSEGISTLDAVGLDRDFHYAHGTVRGQLAHMMIAGQYWLERAFDTTINGSVSSIFAAAETFGATLTDKSIMEPVEYKTSTGQDTANLRWEMLFQLVNHGTDHRAQTLAMLHQLGAPTFEQDMMHFFNEYDDDDSDTGD